MATAQIETWVATHRGSVEQISRTIDALSADSMLARMMLHRRRAVTAQVVDDFFAHAGQRFRPYLEGRMDHAPSDPAKELTAASAACKNASDKLDSLPLPFLFERALVAQAAGRPGDARTDLEQVLALYPGCFTAAFAAARIEFAAGDPGRAIRWLLPVERENARTRDGAGLLADAVRAIGLHEAASRYDLATLLNRGGYDSCGNDCAPVDVAGRVLNDIRMPQIFYFETQTNGTVLCNARGVYYSVNPVFGRILAMFARMPSLSGFLSLGEATKYGSNHLLPEILDSLVMRFSRAESGVGARTRQRPAALKALKVKLRLSVDNLLWPRAVWGWARRVEASAIRVIAGTFLMIGRFLRRTYQRLPFSVRHRVTMHVHVQLASLRAWLRYAVAPHFSLSGEWNWWTFSQISDENVKAQLVRTRSIMGLANIFGLQNLEGTNYVPVPNGAIVSIGTSTLLQMPASVELPPKAAELLNQLVSELEST